MTAATMAATVEAGNPAVAKGVVLLGPDGTPYTAGGGGSSGATANTSFLMTSAYTTA